MTILETHALTKDFGKLRAVNELSIKVEEGEAFGLLGPNGAGKTTVIKMITTILPPTSGTAKVGGYDIRTQSNEVRYVIGYVPQVISADSNLTGFENLMVSAKLYDIPKTGRLAKIEQSLSFMGLLDVRNKLVKYYSGGMIRRLEIAQSMLHRPKLLFLDEPTVGLDPLARKAVWEHVRRLMGEFSTTVFLTTHYMDEADSICNRLAIMHRGKMMAKGTPKELKDSVEQEGATLEDVFRKYTGDTLDMGGSYRETSRTRRVARRLS